MPWIVSRRTAAGYPLFLLDPRGDLKWSRNDADAYSFPDQATAQKAVDKLAGERIQDDPRPVYDFHQVP